MGLFSRSKKNSVTPASANTTTAAPNTPVKPNPGLLKELRNHPTGFYKHAQKDRNGAPIASKVYWNTDPPTPCPDIQQHSVFDNDVEDVERYDSRDTRGPRDRKPTHLFRRIYGPDFRDPSAVRSVGPSPDYTLIRSWLRHCDKEHKQCVADGKTDKLSSITLIDVRNQRLVRYNSGMQYVALSYVWGKGVPIPKRVPGRPSDLPNNISKTIKHAMMVAHNIDVPYLWADAVCINQHDGKEKEQQLPLMDYIYEQAFATIISLGDSANVGLPGIDGGPTRYPQLAAEFGPVKLLSRCPTLQSQIQSSVWSTRGWTYQEGLFSRRCIYMSQHQVYFHCNGMLCTEDSPSVTEIEEPTKGPQSLSRNIRHNTVDVSHVRENSLVRSRMQSIYERAGTMGLYQEFLAQYLHRDISYDEDAINAFGAILARLERDYLPTGFLYGLPRASFAHALFWYGTGITRRKGKDGASVFPSWSWAGWKAVSGGFIGYSSLLLASAPISVPLQISFGEEKVYNPSRTESAVSSGLSLELQRLWNSYRVQFQKIVPLKKIPSPPTATALFMDGPVMTLRAIHDPVTQAVRFREPTNLPNVLQDPSSHDSTKLTGPPRLHDFLVLMSGQGQGTVYNPIQFGLIMLKWETDGVASRAGYLELNVTKDLEIFWKASSVRRGVFWLI